jgi:hypothetical protein
MVTTQSDGVWFAVSKHFLETVNGMCESIAWHSELGHSGEHQLFISVDFLKGVFNPERRK